MVSQESDSVSATKSTSLGRWWVAIGVAVILVSLGIYKLIRPKETPLQRVKKQYISDIAQLDSGVRTLQRAIVNKQPSGECQSLFLEARLRYKRVEFLAELYYPETAKSINGRILPEVDEADKKVEQPEGLQVLEELLSPYKPEKYDETVKQVAVLVSNVGRLGKVAATNEMTNSHVFDAIRLELFRLVSLGITGFDSPIAHHSLPEAEAVLESLKRHVTFYELDEKAPDLAIQVDNAFAESIKNVKKNPDFNRFDRLTFITNHANVLSSLLLDVQKALAIPVFQESRFLAADARTLNDPKAFNPSFFVKSNDDRPTPERIALGKRLFFDPILSGDEKRSCVTCHQPNRAFTDGERTSFAVGANGQRINRNSPTLLNASLQAVQFMDSRVAYLEDQASDVIANEAEMHGSLQSAVLTLKQREDYHNQFSKTYTDGITEHTVKNALASYIRSLTSLDSRVDQYLRRQSASLTEEEKHGFNLFMGKSQCATCHFFPLFNGTVPPVYAKTESEVLGVPATATNQRLDPDLGKFKTTGMDLQKHAFKTPTVRHVSQTAPYMHNGVYQTLDEVIDFYDKGGGTGLSFDLPNQTLPGDKLNLTSVEKKALIAFMKAL